MPDEYYDYRLFDDRRFSGAEKREFTGRRFQWSAYRAVNDPGLVGESGIHGSWKGMIDKVLFDALMRAGGVAAPAILAVYDDIRSTQEGVVSLRTTEQLARFIREAAGEGFFAKPARAASGNGGCAVLGVADNKALLANGEQMGVDALAAQIARLRRAVIQERLVPHPDITAAMGPTLGTMRVVVLCWPNSHEIHRVVFRIPTGRNMVDNFVGGTSGNLLAAVDPLSGRLLRVYGGKGLNQRRLDRHPDTNALLEGMLLPEWPDALDLIKRASATLTGMALQSWDLALTDHGPVMVEANDVSSQDVLQLCGPPGMLDERLCHFLRFRHFRWAYPHPTQARSQSEASPPT